MIKKIDFDDIVDEMKKVGDILVPYNWPQNDPKLENDLHILKNRMLTVDGYSIGLHFTRSDYGDYYLETLQIYGEKCPFLPFCLVAKIGKKFLGEHELYLVEFIRDNRKIYCWSVTLDKEGKPIPPRTIAKSENCDFEGFQYQYIYPSQVNFY